MLYIIGTGLWRGDDISYRGVEACRNSSKIYLDGYTRTFEKEEIEKLEKLIGKKLIIAKREDLEEKLSFLEESKTMDVALLVPGDPFIATTHTTIIMEARKRKIMYEIIHGSSIYDALIGEAGLHIYKVGGSCTIPMREKKIKPYSAYDKIVENTKRGMHTLVFLDTAPENELSVQEALAILQEIENEKKECVATDKNKIVVGCKMGSTHQKLVYGSIRTIKKMQFAAPCAFVFLGKLHFTEEEFLKFFEVEE